MPLPQDLEAAVFSPAGDPGLRCLALLHGATCVGRFDAVPALHALADRLEIPIARRREAALQVAAYGGFPRTIEGLSLLAAHSRLVPSAPSAPGPPTAQGAQVARAAPTAAQASTSEALWERGRVVWERVYADQADEVLAWLGTLAPELPDWVLDEAYGRVLSRPGLSLAERELLGVAALALMALPAPLASHVRGALRNGSNAAAVGDTLRTCRCLADSKALAAIEQALQRLDRNVLRP